MSTTAFSLMQQFMAGRWLADRLERERCLSIDETLQIASQPADGPPTLTSAEPVRRDVKPPNVLIDAAGCSLLAAR